MASTQQPLYPLRLRPIYREKVWGGRKLANLNRVLPGDENTPIGESWELSDLPQTTASGGGGGEARSVIDNGPLAGQTLHQVIQSYGETLLGRLRPTPDGDFPLLAKFLDAQQNLSVQVHPDQAYVKEHPEAHLKSEAWYIIEAAPGAVIYKGVHEGVTPQQLQQAIASDDPKQVEQLLIRVPVKKGDCHYLPSGTCHALGAGILAAEVQTPSDTTFRVYDWGRTGRELHIEPAMQCIHFGPPNTGHTEKRTHIAGMFTTVSRLILCDHFRIERIRMSIGYEQEIPYDQPAVWMVLEGGGKIMPGNDADAVEFAKGQTLLIPGGMDDARLILDDDTTWLEVTFPQALAEQIA